MPFHTKPEGRRLAGEPPKLQGWPAHQDTILVHSRTTTQGSKPYFITHSRANLTLTLTKLVLRTKDLISMLLDGLEVVRITGVSDPRGEGVNRVANRFLS